MSKEKYFTYFKDAKTKEELLLTYFSISKCKSEERKNKILKSLKKAYEMLDKIEIRELNVLDTLLLTYSKGDDVYSKALEICEINIASGKKSHGIKALRLAYKYGDRSSNTNVDNDKRKGSIYMADSKVDVNGELKSVEDMSSEDIAYKLDLKNGTNWSGRNPNAK